jgi:hypothetical protein
MEWPLVGGGGLVAAVVRSIQTDPGSAVLEGDLGVGKTRLSRGVADTLRQRGWQVEFCIGSPAAASIPFGALSHLVPEPSGDVRFKFDRMRREILEKAATKPLLIAVDDANYLDAGSMAACGSPVTRCAQRSGYRRLRGPCLRASLFSQPTKNSPEETHLWLKDSPLSPRRAKRVLQHSSHSAPHCLFSAGPKKHNISSNAH